jgi:predicted nucleic acid-binding protein
VIPGRYWDSATFIGLLRPEPDKFPQTDAVVQACLRGQCRIVTSTLTFAEVHKLKRGPGIDRGQQEALRNFFQHPFIVPYELDRAVADLARELIWSHNVTSWDAVHVATAIRARARKLVECFDTFDQALRNLTGRFADSDFILSQPNLPPVLPFSDTPTA